MNAERLHRIILDIKADLDNNAVVTKFQGMQTHLQNQVNQPQQPAHQTNLVSSLEELYQTLEKSPVNKFSPGWKQIIHEIGGQEILGDRLKDNIKLIFNANQITPAAALQEINKLVSQLVSFKVYVDKLTESFIGLKIGTEELEPGQCEMGYSIPREFIEQRLSSLNKEISDLNFILNNISEAITGEKQEFKVRTISSSDYLLYIIIGLQVADVLSSAIERIINNYKTILEIKLLHSQLKEKGLPDKEVKGIEDHANKLMETEVNKIASEIVKQHYKGEASRKNEITNGLTISLNKIANRIDQGFNIEIRVKELPQPTESEEMTQKDKENFDQLNKIQERSQTLEFIKTEGKPILRLNEENGEKKK